MLIPFLSLISQTFTTTLTSGMKDQFLDINGDGLLDYIYFLKMYQGVTVNSNLEGSCIILNNGNGWDIAYKCVALGPVVDDGYKPLFYGDCADTEKSTL